MHKSYQPLKPATNKYLQKKWDQTCYEDHRNKVRVLMHYNTMVYLKYHDCEY